MSKKRINRKFLLKYTLLFLLLSLAVYLPFCAFREKPDLDHRRKGAVLSLSVLHGRRGPGFYPGSFPWRLDSQAV